MGRVMKSEPHIPKKEVLTLGAIGEVHSYNFIHLGADAEEIVEFIHAVSYVELLSRPIETMDDWSIRVKNMLLRNRLIVVSDVVCLDLKQVNRLTGCGYKTRQEVYRVFNEYGFKVDSWMPGHYWERMSYRFTDE